MKVVRITTSLDYGGIEKVFELHAKFHDQKDYELIFVALEGGGKTAEILKAYGYEVILLGTRSRIPSLETLHALLALLRKLKPDVIHTCGAEANFHGHLAGAWLGIKKRIAEEIGLPNHSRLFRTIFSTIYKLTSNIIAISDAVRNYLVKFEASDTKVVKLYNPIDVSITVDKKKSVSGTFVIATLCRLEPIKNCRVLIDLLSYVNHQYQNHSFQLWFVGDGSERQSLEAYTVEKGLVGKVIFHGYSSKPHSILAKANLFVLPSLKEGFGLACIEAIQCHVPVIVSNNGGMTEYIKDGINGFLFSPTNFNELTNKIDTFMALDSQEVENITSNAFRDINELFSPQRYLRDLLSLYNSKKPIHA